MTDLMVWRGGRVQPALSFGWRKSAIHAG
jgi:hypothetical protein